jgi:hypothetical protein
MKFSLIILVFILYAQSQNMDSVWEVIRQDSINTASKMISQTVKLQDTVILEQPSIISDHDKYVVDSLAFIVDADSIQELNMAATIFKKQINIKTFQVSTRLECLEFLLINKCSTKIQAEKYLIILKKYCEDRQQLYYAMRLTVPDKIKYLAVAYIHKTQEECGKVQNLIDRIEK